MPVRDIERAVEMLSDVRRLEPVEARLNALKKALSDKVNLIVQKAANLAAEMQLRHLIPDLCAAFERLLVQPLKSDPKCWGKEAIAKALKELGHDQSEIFRKGSTHIQLEPVWGGEADTAETLRATCILAFAQCLDMDRHEKLWATMPLLTEQSASSRKDGAVGLEALGGPEAALMLRIKARTGDKDISVTSQVFESLLQVEGDSAVLFIADFLRSDNDEVRSEAAFVLGASRLDGALAVLLRTLGDKHSMVDRATLFRALAISRRDEAIQTLLDQVRNGRSVDAFAALDALKLCRDAGSLRDKVEEAICNRSESDIQHEFRQLFDR